MVVFVSSVMDGFEEERQVAREAVESLDMHAVMAEKFGARPSSPQRACLDGVAECDCYLAILGERYGSLTEAGISVTEEEFREAERLGLPILLITRDGPKEPAQEDFIRRIGGYESGYFLGRYGSVSQLGPAITKALNGLRRGQSSVSTERGQARLRELLGSEDCRSSGVVLRAVFVPIEQREFVDAAELGRQGFKEQLLQPALFGPAAVFSYGWPTQSRDGREHVELLQGEPHREPVNRVQLHTDGALLLQVSPEAEGSDRDVFRMLDRSIIDEGLVADRLERECRYAATVYGLVPARRAPTRVHVQAALMNIGGKLFGPKPKRPVTSISYPMNDLGGSVVVPQKPTIVSLAQLAEGRAVTANLTTLFGRAFRAADAYYDAGRAGR